MGANNWRITMASAGKPRGVLIIVENLPVPFDRRVWQEATTLRSAGYEVTVICPTGRGHEERYAESEGIRIYRYRLPIEGQGAFGYLLEYTWSLAMQILLAIRVYRKHGFDVIHGCNPPDMVFLVALIFKPRGVKFVFDHHDINPELYEAKFERRDVLYRLLRLLERWTFRCADLSIATNESYREIAVERGGMQPDRVFVVRSGPDLRRLKELPPSADLKQGRSYLVGYVGVMGAQEGLDLLLNAVRYIVYKLNRDDIQFVLVGGGTELETLKVMAEELGVSGYVTFTGRVSDDELLAVLNTAEVCVNPDRANDMNDMSTMNKIMEYMALGKPIVQFDLKEGRFSAQDASVYAKRNDANDLAIKIVELLDDPARRARMGQFGKVRVESILAWEHEAPKLLETYERLFQ